MNKLAITLILATIMLSSAQPLKALLFCYLPVVSENKTAEYSKLADMVNQLLQLKNIDVRVQVCDQSTTGAKLYDKDQISSLFDSFDIVQVDVSFLSAVTIPLLSFSKDQITYFDKVFKFEWQPTTTKEGKIIGSPGLLCSSFIQKRLGDYKDGIFSRFGSKSKIVDLYLNTFVNLQDGRTLDDVDYITVDQQVINQMAKFLLQCQNNSSVFNYNQNRCFPGKGNFFQTEYSKTIGYSENLFNFINAGILPSNIEIEHITLNQPKKVFYVDSFVAKDTKDAQTKRTILKFYQFMLSNQILDIYILGKYTNKPSTTYLIPPTIHYFEELTRNDKLYKSIYEATFKDATQLPIYQSAYTQNKDSFAQKIDLRLREISIVTYNRSQL